MSRDPYLDVKREVDNALAQTRDLYTSYTRLSTKSNNQQLISEAKQELETSLGLLEVDIDDLEESVTAVEESGTRWGLTFGEVESRRRALEEVKAVVRNMRSSLSNKQYSAAPSPPYRSTPAQSSNKFDSSMGKRSGGAGGDPFTDIELGNTGNSSYTMSNNDSGQYKDDPSDPYAGRPSDEVREYELEQQQLMMQAQDTTVHRISNTLTTLAQQAGLIGQELMEQNEMLDDLSTRVDSTDNRLQRANKRMTEFIRKNEDNMGFDHEKETASSWCIVILIIVLILLLLFVILI
ncbi:hypothetical protein QFC21_001619 [Naganishia friedmannii]|uniref:Uncharacterized protein n=1 Tax=Naganishia friedmannii TaxID=89922 RepID=A0ACC2W1E4_9TREE|nr:hypothetical protein QFC21_001619 [Naganishia friedmannii]